MHRYESGWDRFELNTLAQVKGARSYSGFEPFDPLGMVAEVRRLS